MVLDLNVLRHNIVVRAIALEMEPADFPILFHPVAIGRMGREDNALSFAQRPFRSRG